jgi:hypothetical protein
VLITVMDATGSLTTEPILGAGQRQRFISAVRNFSYDVVIPRLERREERQVLNSI